MTWERITLRWRTEPRLLGAVRLPKSARHLNMGADLHEALGNPKRVVFLRDGGRLGIMAGEGKISRACHQPSPYSAVRISATGVIRMFGIVPGLYPAHIEEHDGKPIVVVRLQGEGQEDFSDHDPGPEYLGHELSHREFERQDTADKHDDGRR